MAHYRQTIRDAVAAALTGNTGAGANVFTSRARPILEILQRKEQVLSVYTADESSERNGDGYQLARRLTVSIEGMAGGGDDLDDVLDDLAAEVEAAIDADPMLGNVLSEELVLVGTTSEITARGNQQVGAFKLDFECAYLTERQVPNYLPGDLPGDTITVPPVPTVVTTSTEPSAIGYVEPLTPAVLTDTPIPAPAPDDGEALPLTQQDDVVRAMDTDVTLQPAQPAAATDSVCDDEAGCDLPAWGGEQ